jgi:tetratricopeptide (TPR) repeat protein
MGGTLRTLPEIHAGFQRMRALLAAAQGDTATALSVIRVLDTLTASPDDQFRVRSMAETVRAYMAYRAGQYQTALDLLERRLHTTWPGFAVTSAGKGESFERFLRAEVLRQLQRPMEALGWYASFDEHAVHDLMYLAPALLRSAELNRSLGRPQLAAEQLGRAARLWQGADPEFRLYLARQVRIDGDPPASEPE